MRCEFILAAGTALLSSAIASPVARSCSSTYVRKEWRELSSSEQADFIAALKVGCIHNDVPMIVILTYSAQCLGNKPHSTLAPTGFTSGIVDINPSSSRSDDFVYAHMDTNVKYYFTGRKLFLCLDKPITNDRHSFLAMACLGTDSPRCVPDSFTLGIGGTSRHS